MKENKLLEFRLLLSQLKHDLGKHIALNVRAILQHHPEEPLSKEDLEALSKDLARTRVTPGGVFSAFDLWEIFKTAIQGLSLKKPERDRLGLSKFIPEMDRWFQRLAELSPPILNQDLKASQAIREDYFSTVMKISEGIRSYCQDVRGKLDEE